MSDYASRILAIGLVNSGMFDLLKLNMDVQAIHLIGQNNVGKTSLIALIQFLYFHNLREMTFSKPLAESLAFYFPREGGYILFQVRTIHGAMRTVGVYGTGTADSREIFCFDGGFDLRDFVDAQQCVLPLHEVQERFFDRGFRRYQRFEEYERALIGQLADAAYNVQMFDLSMTNFRLLRDLLQGLLRLDRITSGDVRHFLIKMIETGAVKTRISIAQDYERKNREIQGIYRQLRELEALRPIIEQWRSLTGRLAAARNALKGRTEHLYHVSFRYLAFLTGGHDQIQAAYRSVDGQIDQRDQRRLALAQERAVLKTQMEALQAVIGSFERLEAACGRYVEMRVKQEHEELIHQRIELQNMLDAVQPADGETLRRQRRRLERERAEVRRQMESLSLDQLWLQAGLSEEQRALLRFLFSRRLIRLPVADVVTEREAFLAAARRAVGYLTEDGTFAGFGLAIPRREWYEPEQEVETLEEQLARAEQELRVVEHKIEAAEDRSKKEADLRGLHDQIRHCERILQQFTDLARLREEQGSLADCRHRLEDLRSEQQQLGVQIAELETEIRALRQRSEDLFAQAAALAGRLQQVDQTHRELQPFETACPAAVQALPEGDLETEYLLSQDRIHDTRNAIARLSRELEEPEIQLQARYERESPDMTFARWVELKLDIANEIERFNEQLYESYSNLITLMRGELDKLVQAFEAVESRVAALNNMVRRARVSNIERIEVRVRRSQVVEAIRETDQLQLDLFSLGRQRFSFEEAQVIVDDYLSQIRMHGRDLSLEDLFTLEFAVTFAHSSQPLVTTEIHQLESHGTETGIKVVLYLGLIRLLQSDRKALGARVPFFLDEVGSIDSSNLKQLIAYCDQNNFLPIFASPEIRQDIPYSYIFQRRGARSELVNEIVITGEPREVVDEPA